MAVTDREVQIQLGIVVEKRKSNHPWTEWSWKPVAVLMNPPEQAAWTELRRGADFVQYHAGSLPLVLHRKDTEALRLNLMGKTPELYVVLEEGDAGSSEFPYQPHIVTASSYDAQDYADAGEAIMEKVAMPEAVAAFVQAFVEHHHEETEFKKRRRDRLDPDEQKFGKAPIFVPHTKR